MSLNVTLYITLPFCQVEYHFIILHICLYHFVICNDSDTIGAHNLILSTPHLFYVAVLHQRLGARECHSASLQKCIQGASRAPGYRNENEHYCRIVLWYLWTVSKWHSICIAVKSWTLQGCISVAISHNPDGLLLALFHVGVLLKQTLLCCFLSVTANRREHRHKWPPCCIRRQARNRNSRVMQLPCNSRSCGIDCHEHSERSNEANDMLMLLSLFQQAPVWVLAGSPQTGARARTSTHQLLYTINPYL